MKILLAVDTENYSQVAAQEAARFAVNTWADVTLLGLEPAEKGNNGLSPKLIDALKAYMEHFTGPSSPFNRFEDASFVKRSDKMWEMLAPGQEGRKTLRVVGRRGDALENILSQAWEDEPDFLFVGGAGEGKPEWLGEINLPQKLASMAPCSVLVVKEKKEPETVVCCLDHDHVSQESLEMINQLVTLHKAELKIVGVTDAKGLAGKVETKMNEVLTYYTERGIRSWVELVKTEELNQFAKNASASSLIGLWLGKQSLLKKIFSKKMLEQLVSEAGSSVLILK